MRPRHAFPSLGGALASLGLATTAVAQGPRVSPVSASWSEAHSTPSIRALATYQPNYWKRGLVIGAVVGTALAVVSLTQCDSDANADCPGWGRAAGLVVVGTGSGALIGALIHRHE
jgi:hypothetical protein